MVQEIGETRDAIMADNEKRILSIIDANQARRDKYWIVVFAKGSKFKLKGRPALMQVIKAYAQKPTSQVGLMCCEVDNIKGSLEWEINMPQAPIDYDAIMQHGAGAQTRTIIETSTIPEAYITR